MENYESLKISEKYQVLKRWFRKFTNSLDSSDTEYSVMLLELVLEVAVKDEKQISLIMQLEAEDQMTVAAAISHVQRDLDSGDFGQNERVGNDTSTPEKQPQEKNNSDELNLSANDHTNLQRIHNLENQLQHVQEHNHELEAQSELLEERLKTTQNNESFQADSDQFQQKMSSYQDLNDELQEENYRIEILKNEYAERLTDLSGDCQVLVEEVKQKNLVLMEVQLMRDEIDFLKEEAERSSLRGICLEEVIVRLKREKADFDGVKNELESKNAEITNLNEKLKFSKTTASQRLADRETMNQLKNESKLLKNRLKDEQNKREITESKNKNLSLTITNIKSERDRMKNDFEKCWGSVKKGDSLKSEFESIDENEGPKKEGCKADLIYRKIHQKVATIHQTINNQRIWLYDVDENNNERVKRPERVSERISDRVSERVLNAASQTSENSQNSELGRVSRKVKKKYQPKSRNKYKTKKEKENKQEIKL